MPENFNSDKTLKAGSHPSLFEGGKKKVILKPSASSSTPAAKPKRELLYAPMSYIHTNVQSISGALCLQWLSWSITIKVSL